jgi:hypothetical protein
MPGTFLQPKVATEVGFTVADRLVQGIFRCFEHDLYPAKEAIVIHKVASDGANALVIRIAQLLVESGLAPVMPLLKRVVCFSGGGMSVLATVKELMKMISVTVSRADAARQKHGRWSARKSSGGHRAARALTTRGRET